jgi:putative PIN family toxin of toxin-antitoxin system
MIRVVLDSNVYLSALLFGGNPRTVLELAQARAFGLVISMSIIQEIESVLKTKFLWTDTMIRRAAAETWGTAHKVKPEMKVDDCVDPDDNRVLECALASNAGFIVTGDRHLLRLTPFRDPDSHPATVSR